MEHSPETQIEWTPDRDDPPTFNAVIIYEDGPTGRHAKLFNVSCRFECPQPVLVGDNAVATHLYRIVQEAISNAVKHGQARSIIVRLSGPADQTTLRVWNNGAGFSVDANAEGGLGLRIMQYRAEMIGATLKISSDSREGTAVRCTFKMNG